MVFALQKRKKQLNILYSDHLLLDACFSPPTDLLTRGEKLGDPWACGDHVT
jgi:hypothetical protein